MYYSKCEQFLYILPVKSIDYGGVQCLSHAERSLRRWNRLGCREGARFQLKESLDGACLISRLGLVYTHAEPNSLSLFFTVTSRLERVPCWGCLLIFTAFVNEGYTEVPANSRPAAQIILLLASQSYWHLLELQDRQTTDDRRSILLGEHRAFVGTRLYRALCRRQLISWLAWQWLFDYNGKVPDRTRIVYVTRLLSDIRPPPSDLLAITMVRHERAGLTVISAWDFRLRGNDVGLVSSPTLG
jgi:hypothetical protein